MFLRRSTPTFKTFLCGTESRVFAFLRSSFSVSVDNSAHFDPLRTISARAPCFSPCSFDFRYSAGDIWRAVRVHRPFLCPQISILFEIFEKYGLAYFIRREPVLRRRRVESKSNAQA
jgi:hypothetical protein